MSLRRRSAFLKPSYRLLSDWWGKLKLGISAGFDIRGIRMAGLDFDPFGGSDPFSSLGRMPGIEGSAPRPRQRAYYRRPLPADESSSLASQALNTGASGLSYILGTLDKPGQAVRGVLAGKGASSLKHLIPFSDTLGITTEADQTSGRDLTNKLGITDRRDNGWGSWGLGLAADIATDPLNYATFGAKSALTPVGKALQKGGHLKGWSREALLRGYNALEPDLTAAGKTASQITHMADRGARIASPEAVAAANAAGGLKAGQPLAGLARLSVPFGGPGVTLGTGKIGLRVARGLDKAADYLQFGNPVGRAIGAMFDPSRHEAVDASTQRGARKYLDPSLAELNQQGRDQAYGILSQLDPLIREGKFSEQEITEAARAAGENTPFVGMANPMLQLNPTIQQVGRDINAIEKSHLATAQAAGTPLADVADPYANYVHRQALDVNHANLQLGGVRTKGNLYPVVSGANMHREELLRGIPGGTARINDWYRRFAATKDVPGATRAIKKDMVADLRAGGGTITPALGKEFDAKATGLAERLAGASERHLPSAEFPEGLGLFTPNLAADSIQRNAQHARTVSAAKAAIGTIGDVARKIDPGNPGGLVPVTDVGSPGFVSFVA